MSVSLVGGAFDPATAPALLATFLAEVRDRAAGRPRIAVLLLDRDGSMDRFLPEYVDGLGDAEMRSSCRWCRAQQLDAETVARGADVDGILRRRRTGRRATTQVLGRGGRTCSGRPGRPHGTPYAGFSAGAMVAGEQALLGGYLVDGHEVCEEGCSEDLEELTVRPGLGLVPFTCDVHITAAGTLGRALEVVGAGLVDTAVGLDEDTCLTVPPGRPARGGRRSPGGAARGWSTRASPARWS